jgi:hypothetical protein
MKNRVPKFHSSIRVQSIRGSSTTKTASISGTPASCAGLLVVLVHMSGLVVSVIEVLIGFARIGFAARRPRARASGSASCHCSMAGASSMTAAGCAAMPSARMWLSARCSRQIGAPGHFTSAGLHRWFSAQQIAQHDSGCPPLST